MRSLIGVQVRAREGPHAQSRRLQQGARERRGGALAVGAGDVDDG